MAHPDSAGKALLRAAAQLTTHNSQPVPRDANMTHGVQKPRSETAAAKIAEYIAQHGLQPGDRLPAGRGFGEQLGVSRTVVREAVKMLATTGFVRARQGSGLYV